MLEPRKTKFRKQFRGKMGGVAMANNKVSFGEYGIKALTRGWVSAREIEAARKAIVGSVKRKGKVWIKIFPHKPITNKPVNSKLGKGKGAVVGYVAVVKPGTVLFEMGGVDEASAREAMRLAGHKLSVKTRFVKAPEFN